MLTMNLKGHSAFIKKKLFSDCKKEKKKSSGEQKCNREARWNTTTVNSCLIWLYKYTYRSLVLLWNDLDTLKWHV